MESKKKLYKWAYKNRKRLTVRDGIYGCQGEGQGEGIVREFGIDTYTLLYFKWVTNKVPRWLSGKESACHCRRHEFNPWVGKMPWSRKWQLTPVFLPGKSHGQRSLVDYSPWGCGESDTTKWISMNRGVIAQHIKLSGLLSSFFLISHNCFIISFHEDKISTCLQIFANMEQLF